MRFQSGASGEYYFRTVKPGAYHGPTPHIHFAVKFDIVMGFTPGDM